MAITIDYSTYVISVPRADMSIIQASPEIRELNVNQFRLDLKNIEDSEEGMPYWDTHDHKSETTLSGIVYARIVEILSPYTITFEDAQYTVSCTGANHNIADVKNANQVSLLVNNAAGLISNEAIEFSSFEGAVHIDTANGSSGTTFPVGTPQEPVNNWTDAIQICTNRGLTAIHAVGDLTVSSGVDLTGFRLSGDGMSLSTITLDAGATLNDLELMDATITGVLGSDVHITNCLLSTLTISGGHVHRCILDDVTITLAGNAPTHFLSCWSGVPGAGTPVIDLGGSGQDLAIRAYSGGIKLINKSGAGDSVSADLLSGHLNLDSTITAGTVVCRGVGKITDSSVGATINTDGLMSEDAGVLSLIRMLLDNEQNIEDVGGELFLKTYDDEGTLLRTSALKSLAGGTATVDANAPSRRGKGA
ncbi:MAG: hypothetical protein ACXABY_02395 [Candidatus Thorarchaeota archaeon]|jgi:hypothetical protein